ncbi:hypothetical protein ACQ4PT_014393 [Festuca glaucescens]
MAGVAETVALVDTLQRLGLDSHFREEIAASISRIHVAGEGRREFAGSDDLHVAATRFRLLRQHGFWVSADVFDKFRDGAGNFCATDNARVLLSLYHAAHMAVPGESALDDAIAFARRHLQAMKCKLRSPAAEQVSRALDHPLPRWDENAVSVLPKYLRTLYIKTLCNFKEFEDLLEPHEKYRMSYAKKAFQLQMEYYMQEAEWTNGKYQPSFEEHEELSSMSTGLPMLNLMALMGYDGAVATQELFDWMSTPAPDVVRAGAVIGRFLNDISSYKLGKSKNDVDSSVECYMQEKRVTGEEAVAAIAAMTEHRWRVLNQACMETDRALLPGVQLVASIARTCEVIYLRGRDGYTFGSHAKDLVTALFLDTIPL